MLPHEFNPPEDISIQPITEKNVDHVIAFDQSVSLVNRSKELKVFTESEHTVAAYCAVRDGSVVGFIIMRKGQVGIRSSGFYATDVQVAEALFYKFVHCNLVPGTKVAIGFSRANLDQCKSLYEKFGLKAFVDTDKGMYTKADIPIRWDNVYSVFEFFAQLV